jgi:hypothetical protein
MAYDALSVLQALVTKATSFTSTAVDLKTGTPRRGLKARMLVSNYSGASAGHTFTPTIEGSSDNTTFVTLSTGPVLTTTTAAQTAENFISFETSYRYVRLNVTLSGTTGTPTISYLAVIGQSRPA